MAENDNKSKLKEIVKQTVPAAKMFYGVKDIVDDARGVLRDMFNHDQTQKQADAVDTVLTSGANNNVSKNKTKLRNFRGVNLEVPVDDKGKRTVRVKVGVEENTESDTEYK